MRTKYTKTIVQNRTIIKCDFCDTGDDVEGDRHSRFISVCDVCNKEVCRNHVIAKATYTDDSKPIVSCSECISFVNMCWDETLINLKWGDSITEKTLELIEYKLQRSLAINLERLLACWNASTVLDSNPPVKWNVEEWNSMVFYGRKEHPDLNSFDLSEANFEANFYLEHLKDQPLTNLELLIYSYSIDAPHFETSGFFPEITRENFDSELTGDQNDDHVDFVKHCRAKANWILKHIKEMP